MIASSSLCWRQWGPADPLKGQQGVQAGAGVLQEALGLPDPQVCIQYLEARGDSVPVDSDLGRQRALRITLTPQHSTSCKQALH